jgi:hypothetical protein
MLCKPALLVGLAPLVVANCLLSRDAQADPVWAGYAGDGQHTALSSVASQPLQSIHWQTPVDLNPQFTPTGELLIHYGSPLITQNNTVIVPVKTGATDGFELSASNGATGASLWTLPTDYTLGLHDWTPPYAPALTPTQTLYYPGAGGTVLSVSDPQSPTPGPPTRTAFFGDSNYNANPSVYNTNVFIDTPITSDSAGNVYFGFQVTGATPAGLQSGIARIAANGTGTYVAASTVSGVAGINQVVQNSAPAVSPDGKSVYVEVSNGSSGYLLSLNSSTLGLQSKVALTDPNTGQPAWLNNDGTASPMVGPNGDVYMGVLENPYASNHDRGWMLHFSPDLSTTKTPGAFGWDDTASVVPASMVPSYHGSSQYLLMTKYNNYAGEGGDGVNKLAILDPSRTEIDPVTGATVMAEVLTVAGPTPDPEFTSKDSNAVREWCINSAVVDPATDSILANSEDGNLYRWNLATNTLSEKITLTGGVGEAYTPTLIGADGTVYAINDATLYAVGAAPEPAAILSVASMAALIICRRRRR